MLQFEKRVDTCAKKKTLTAQHHSTGKKIHISRQKNGMFRLKKTSTQLNVKKIAKNK